VDLLLLSCLHRCRLTAITHSTADLTSTQSRVWPSRTQSQSRSYFTTGCLPPICSSWRQAPHDDIVLSQNRDSPNLYSQVPVFISPTEQGDPVITPDTGFPFRRLLRLAGLRWTYSHHWLRSTALAIQPRYGPHRRHLFQDFLYCRALVRYHNTCLLSRHLEADSFFWFHYLGLFRCHIKILLFIQFTRRICLINFTW
jgi:hypothetical protein